MGAVLAMWAKPSCHNMQARTLAEVRMPNAALTCPGSEISPSYMRDHSDAGEQGAHVGLHLCLILCNFGAHQRAPATTGRCTAGTQRSSSRRPDPLLALQQHIQKRETASQLCHGARVLMFAESSKLPTPASLPHAAVDGCFASVIRSTNHMSCGRVV